MTAPRKKLIEVSLPLDAINAASAKEKSIRHGHPATLHQWWAPRPLVACRAVLFASLVDDPSAHPNLFPTDDAQAEERKRLFEMIEDLVRWENSNNRDLLAAARGKIAASCDGELPVVLDPFAGSGSIPLEAQRLGLRVFASDLNPVAVIINTALIEIPPRFADQAPVHPNQEGAAPLQRWSGAQGLAADVHYYGSWIRDEAERRLGHLYPTVTLPASQGGGEATVIAWLWARTVCCPNPACGSTMPLAASFWLSKKKARPAWVAPVVRDGRVSFQIKSGTGRPPDPPKVGRGAKFRCLSCREVAPDLYVHSEIDTGRCGHQLMAVAAEGNRQRVYLPASQAHQELAMLERPEGVATAQSRGTFGSNAEGRRYGFKVFADYFTPRQLTTLSTLADLVVEVREQIESDAVAMGMSGDSVPLRDGGSGARAYSEAISVYLALAVDKCADLGNSLCSWEPQAECPRHLFSRQAIPMVWDYAEGNLLGTSSGSWVVVLNGIVRTFESRAWPAPSGSPEGRVGQIDAMASLPAASAALVSTDPPYYDNIRYADLADFFYVWLRRSLGSVFPEVCSTLLTPKSQELVADSYRFSGNRDAADDYFESGLRQVFDRLGEIQDDRYPLTIYYAFKQSETTEQGVASTGWEAMLQSLLDAGHVIHGTWPVRTEMSTRMVAAGTNALASSIVLVCRRRADTSRLATRREFLNALKSELPTALRLLREGGIAPVDMAQAAIGPGMAVFSRYARVMEASGEIMRVRTALELINETLDEVAEGIDADFDYDTRWAVSWFAEYGFEEGEFGRAELLSKSRNTSVAGLAEAGLVESGAGKVRLLRRAEMDPDWDPATDRRFTVWEVAHHLIHRIHEQGEEAAATLLHAVGGYGESAKELAYRLYLICERKGWAAEALDYNSLVTSWPELTKLAATAPATPITLL